MSEEDLNITIKVFRFDPSMDPKPRYDSFTIPYDEEETILGILKRIVRDHDPSLVFRESCRIGNCSLCSMKVNGKGVLACRKPMKDFGKMDLVIEPLHQDKVIRDL
ncbi:MAG TPA: 2Fe-2S iron-sulfur cluster-binding protein, partial [Thermodesulfobacteriota bacterium]|nr:2Fe-2S iron-sulfur cluster-binding protein [Thermodesulfobacteriota bacterium]